MCDGAENDQEDGLGSTTLGYRYRFLGEGRFPSITGPSSLGSWVSIEVLNLCELMVYSRLSYGRFC